MAASPSVAESEPARKQLACNCTRVVSRAGELRPVKSRTWDCPSCGLDKQRRLAEMCMVADPQWLVTLTFSQPDASGPIPERHSRCRADTHVYEYRDGTYRWRVMGTCQHCCRNVSAMLTKWRKRVRRLFGDQVQIITAKEDHKSGALHIHLGLCGLPPHLTRDQRAVLKQHWEELGGGYSDYSPRRSRRGEALGYYLGKYIAKRHDQKMSRGFRRWSRTAGFAPEIAMRVPPPLGWLPPEWAFPLAELRHVGWQHPVTKETVPDRYWPD